MPAAASYLLWRTRLTPSTPALLGSTALRLSAVAYSCAADKLPLDVCTAMRRKLEAWPPSSRSRGCSPNSVRTAGDPQNVVPHVVPMWTHMGPTEGPTEGSPRANWYATRCDVVWSSRHGRAPALPSCAPHRRLMTPPHRPPRRRRLTRARTRRRAARGRGHRWRRP